MSIHNDPASAHVCAVLRGMALALLALLLPGMVASADTGAEVFVQIGHAGFSSAVAFSPDGRLLASAGMDDTIKLWDLSSNRQLATLTGHTDIVNSVVFSPDSRVLYSSARDRTIKFWDVASGREQRSIAVMSGAIIALSLDGHALAVAGLGGSIELLDAANGQKKMGVSNGSFRVAGLAFSPNGRTLAVASMDQTVSLWDLESGTVAQTLSGHQGGVAAVAFSMDGTKVASNSKDGTVKLWDAASGGLLKTLKVGMNSDGSLAFSADDSLIYVGNDRAVSVWRVADGSRVGDLEGPSIADGRIAISPSGATLASGTWSGAIVLYDLASAKETGVLSGKSSQLISLALSADQTRLAESTMDKTVRIWDLAEGRLLTKLPSAAPAAVDLRAFGQTSDLAFSPDGKTLAAGGEADTFSLWDWASGTRLRTYGLHKQDATLISLAFAPDGRSVVTTGYAEAAKVWGVAPGVPDIMLDGHAHDFSFFSPDGRMLASALMEPGDSHSSSPLALWDAANGRQLRIMRDETIVLSAAFSPDGRLLASGGLDKSVKLWSVSSGTMLRSLNGEHQNGVISLAFSPDSRRLASGGSDNVIKLWNVADGNELASLKGHLAPVIFVGFTGPRSLLVSGSRDSTVKLWDPASGRLLATLIAFDDGGSLTITPEGYYDYQGDGAEDNINVRVGDQVTGIGALREQFYRPDLVRMALAGQALPGGLPTLSAIKPAPEVHLGGVPGKIPGETLDLHVGLTDRGGGIGEVRVYVNGSAVSQVSGRDLGVAATGASRTIPLRLVSGSNEIKVIAFNAAGSLQSGAALATVVADYTPLRKPQLHALVVGIDQFDNPRLQLRYSVADATAVAGVLRQKAGKLFDKVEVELLTTPQATTRDALLAAFDRYRTIAPGDVFVFYVASHGTVAGDSAASQAYYLIPSNVGLTSDEALKRDALSQDDLKRAIANIPATKKVLLLDTCQSGALGDALALKTRGLDDEAAVQVLSSAVGSTVLAATTSQEQAIEGKDGHGVFTWVLLQGLAGQADVRHTGYVNTLDLAAYVGDEVPRIADSVFKQKQYPNLHNAGQAFPLVSVGQ